MNKIKLRKKKKENFTKFSFLIKMDSVDLITKNEIEDWALPHISKVVKEVNASNGQVKQVKFSKFFIEIMSNISNLTRYDKISKDSIVTYSLPSKTDFLLKSSPLFTV